MLDNNNLEEFCLQVLLCIQQVLMLQVIKYLWRSIILFHFLETMATQNHCNVILNKALCLYKDFVIYGFPISVFLTFAVYLKLCGLQYPCLLYTSRFHVKNS